MAVKRTIRRKPRKALKPGVTVITATNKPAFIKNLFRNFKHQRWPKKELIVILNNDKMNIDAYKRYARLVGQSSVFRMPSSATLGQCLNRGIQKAKYGIIAKLDDDDYYGPLYLREAIHKFKKTNADIVGKRTFFMYLRGSKTLIMASKASKQSVAGATLMFRKKMFPGVKFSRMKVGSDMRFLNDALKKGFKVQSTSPHFFAAVRRSNQSDHTWKINAQTLKLLRAKTVARTNKFHRIVDRNL